MITYIIILLLFLILQRQQSQHLYKDSIKDKMIYEIKNPQQFATPDLNYPSKGYPGRFYQVGILRVNNIILPLYGRMTYPGSNRYEYHTKNQRYNQINIPLETHDGKILNNGDQVYVSDYELTFTVSLYETHPLRYLPYFDFQKSYNIPY